MQQERFLAHKPSGMTLKNVLPTGSNLTKVCLVGAGEFGAKLLGVNAANAVMCRTKMPNGAPNNSGCSLGSECCPAVMRRIPAPLGNAVVVDAV